MRSLIVIFGLVATASAAELSVDAVEFAGYMAAGTDRLFVLFDPRSKETSSWVKLEVSWHGYRLIAFDAQREMLVVAKGAEKLELKLRSAQVVEGRSLPKLLKGTATASGDSIVYSSDAELSVSATWVVRATSGTMTYSVTENTLRGDFSIDDSALQALMIAQGGVMKWMNGGPVVTASKMSVQKMPNKAPEPTP